MMKIRHTVLTMCAALAVATGIAGEVRHTEFDLSWIADQHVLGVNKEEGHATFVPYESRAALMADERYERPWAFLISDLMNAVFCINSLSSFLRSLSSLTFSAMMSFAP